MILDDIRFFFKKIKRECDCERRTRGLTGKPKAQKDLPTWFDLKIHNIQVWCRPSDLKIHNMQARDHLNQILLGGWARVVQTFSRLNRRGDLWALASFFHQKILDAKAQECYGPRAATSVREPGRWRSRLCSQLCCSGLLPAHKLFPCLNLSLQAFVFSSDDLVWNLGFGKLN